MIQVKKNGSIYSLYSAAGERLRDAATWQELDNQAKQLARDNRDLYRRTEPVTPHDTNTIPATSSIRVGAAGDVAVTFDGDTNDTAVVIASVAVAGEGPVMRVNRVRETATTATGITAVYDYERRF